MIAEALIPLCIGVGFLSVAGMTVLSYLMIGETTEDLEPFGDWLIFSWASLPFRPDSLTIEGLKYRRWYLRLLFAFVAAILVVFAIARIHRT